MGIGKKVLEYGKAMIVGPIKQLAQLIWTFIQVTRKKLKRRFSQEKKTCYAKLAFMSMYFFASMVMLIVNLAVIIVRYQNNYQKRSVAQAPLYFLMLLENCILFVQVYSDLYTMFLLVGMQGLCGTYLVYVGFDSYKLSDILGVPLFATVLIYMIVNCGLFVMSYVQHKKNKTMKENTKLRQSFEMATGDALDQFDSDASSAPESPHSAKQEEDEPTESNLIKSSNLQIQFTDDAFDLTQEPEATSEPDAPTNSLQPLSQQPSIQPTQQQSTNQQPSIQQQVDDLSNFTL